MCEDVCVCADTAIVLEAVRGNKFVFFFFLFIHFVTQFRVHEYGVQVQNTLFQENNTLCSKCVQILWAYEKISRDIL